jgi:hypothetical protein
MKFLLLLVLFFCKPKVPLKAILPLDESKINVQFSYGEIPGSTFRKSESLNWNPIVQEENGVVCLFSSNSLYREREYGPNIDICTSVIINDIPYLNSFFESDVESINLRYNNDLEIHTLSLSEIVSLWKENPPLFLMVGDRFLEGERVESGINVDTFYSLYGDSKNINSIFSMPYFSMWREEKHWNIAFPKKFNGGRKTSIKYLIFSIPASNLPDLDFHKIVKQIEDVHVNSLKNCQEYLPIFTEYQPISSSQTLKFIEWKNPYSEPICINNFKLKLGEKNFEEKNITGFYFPGEITLIGESESKYQIHTEVNLDWKDLKPNSSLSFITSQSATVWEDITKKPTKFLEGESSIKNEDKQCSETIDLSTTQNLCSDPGIDIKISTNRCEIDQFYLTEINPIGIDSNSRGKYIELQYKGTTQCDLSDVSLLFGEFYIPLSIKKNLIFPQSIIVIGNSDFFEKVFILDRDLRTFDRMNPIYLKNSSQIYELYTPPSSLLEYFLNRTDGISYTLVPEERNWKIHTLFTSNHVKEGFKNKIIGSPGEIISATHQSGKGYLSEINIFGSYSNSESFSQDKFLEIDVDPSIESGIKLFYLNGKIEQFVLPPQKEKTKIVLGKNQLFCYPEVPIYVNENIILSKEIIKIELLSGDTRIDVVQIEGLDSLEWEDRTQRVRKSLSRVEDSNNWRNSYSFSMPYKSNPNCFPYTHSTPGESNSYTPLLNLISRNFPLLKFYSLIPYNTTQSLFEYSIYSNENHQSQGVLSFFNRKLENSFNLSTFDPESLLYVRWKDSSELSVIPPRTLRIQAVLPHPSLAQNEWVYICNSGNENEFIKNFEIQDSTFFDKLVAYSVRFPLKNPMAEESDSFIFTKDFLSPDECGYIIDPDATNLNLKFKSSNQIPIFTVASDFTIGNGISTDESLNLYKIKNNSKVLVSSYGNQYSHSPFKFKLGENEIIELKEGRTGEGIYDYRIVK